MIARRSRCGRHLILVALVAMTACADPRPRTEVLVMFEADRAVQLLARDLQIDVYAGERGDAVPALLVQSLPLSLDSIAGFPVTHALVPTDEDAAGLFRIEGRLYDGQSPDEPIAAVRAISGYVKGRTLILRLRFYARCLYVDCTNPDESCGATGNCEPATELPGDLPPISDMDGGIEPFCTNDIDCDDTIGCTVDTCLTDSCINTADDSLCTVNPGGTCDPVAGCQYGACEATTCVAGPCEESATCQSGVCVRASRCRIGEQCCGDSCVPSSCNDGEVCTTDGCDPAAGACTSTAATGACDDGVFCNGVDTCSASGCSTHAGPPCSGTSMCDETDDTCVSCLTAADCPSPSTMMGACMRIGTNMCSTAGSRSVEMTSYTCTTGMCERMTTMSSSSCTVAASTMPCATGTPGPFGSCTPTSGLCGSTGSHSATASVFRCGTTGMCNLPAGTTTITESCLYTRPALCSDGGVPRDSGPRCDAGLCDAGVRDSGPRDSGPPDSGLRDGGPEAGSADGGGGAGDGATMMTSDATVT